MRITRPFVLLALAVVLAPCAEASRTSVWESNPPAAAVLARPDAAAALASLAPADHVDVDAVELPRFDLGDVVLIEYELEREERFDLGPLTLVDLSPLRGPPPSYPETRVGGFELLPPFRVGASATLSLWSRQACGSISCALVSDGPQDPWGLYSWGDFRKDVTDTAKSYYGFLGQAALEGNGVYQLYNTVKTAKALAARTKELYKKGGASAVADAAVTEVALSLPIVNTIRNASRVVDTYEKQGAFEGGRQMFRTTRAAATDVAAVAGMARVATAPEPSMSIVPEGGWPVTTRPSTPPNNPRQYSVAFETELPLSEWGKSESVHFNRANAALDSALQSDAAYAQGMEQLIPGVGASVAKQGGRVAPEGWLWEHASSSTTGGRKGVMRLVPVEQHTPGSPWWRVIHPDAGAAGGYAEWARPAGAPARK